MGKESEVLNALCYNSPGEKERRLCWISGGGEELLVIEIIFQPESIGNGSWKRKTRGIVWSYSIGQQERALACACVCMCVVVTGGIDGGRTSGTKYDFDFHFRAFVLLCAGGPPFLLARVQEMMSPCLRGHQMADDIPLLFIQFSGKINEMKGRKRYRPSLAAGFHKEEKDEYPLRRKEEEESLAKRSFPFRIAFHPTLFWLRLIRNESKILIS